MVMTVKTRGRQQQVGQAHNRGKRCKFFLIYKNWGILTFLNQNLGFKIEEPYSYAKILHEIGRHVYSNIFNNYNQEIAFIYAEWESKSKVYPHQIMSEISAGSVFRMTRHSSDLQICNFRAQ